MRCGCSRHHTGDSCRDAICSYQTFLKEKIRARLVAKTYRNLKNMEDVYYFLYYAMAKLVF